MPKLSENINLTLKSVLPLIVVIILSFIAVPFGISKVTDLQGQINTLQNNKNILSQKLSLLQSISATVSQDSESALSAVPNTNTTLVAISQVKNISSQNGVSVSNIKAGSEVVDSIGTSHVAVSFRVAGSRSQILAFLKDVSNMAPIALVNIVKISGNNDSEAADITIESYWAPLPKTLPTLTSPINDLTANEKSVLTSVTSLIQPTFSIVPPTDGAGKTDPFTQ